MTILFGIAILGIIVLVGLALWHDHKYSILIEKRIIDRETGRYRTPEFKYETTVTTKKDEEPKEPQQP
jgi:hypothetical protein